MILFIIGGYFIVAILLAWIIAFGPARSYLVSLLSRISYTIQQCSVASEKISLINKADSGPVSKLRFSFAIIGHGFPVRNGWIALSGLVVAALPPLAVVYSGQNYYGEGFPASYRESNLQIQALLEGEQLVPPEPLPPALFAAQDVMAERPLLISASRHWNELDNGFSQRLLKVFKIMKDQYGYDMAIIEGYRSPERQNKLAALGPQVTNAFAYQSFHQFGLAADCAFLRDGRLVISERDPWALRGYQLYGQVAEAMGLRWGGRWKLLDYGHVELHLPGVLKS